MLVLTRRVNEEIIIDGQIRIVVLEAQRDRVRIGVAAPSSMRVDRMEVHQRRINGGSVAAHGADVMPAMSASY